MDGIVVVVTQGSSLRNQKEGVRQTHHDSGLKETWEFGNLGVRLIFFLAKKRLLDQKGVVALGRGYGLALAFYQANTKAVYLAENTTSFTLIPVKAFLEAAGSSVSVSRRYWNEALTFSNLKSSPRKQD